ncbi:Hypothetical_protein [Hexamita inflata]|uniref:Hypothetical_protein n=1 Tax=Hexamita inflata TaxID=28002 RepID=A0AA86QWS7_9EUKA|nr:Hypothetical protein HINF_LOCUS55176 [Hexamita inflata]
MVASQSFRQYFLQRKIIVSILDMVVFIGRIIRICLMSFGVVKFKQLYYCKYICVKFQIQYLVKLIERIKKITNLYILRFDETSSSLIRVSTFKTAQPVIFAQNAENHRAYIVRIFLLQRASACRITTLLKTSSSPTYPIQFQLYLIKE